MSKIKLSRNIGTKIRPIGNSRCVIIPRIMLRMVNWNIDDVVTLEYDITKDIIIIHNYSKQFRKPQKSEYNKTLDGEI